jgi:hypothetical protein
VRGDQRPHEELAAALAEAGIDDALVANDSAERTRLWRFREAPREAISAAASRTSSTSASARALAEFAARVPRGARLAPGARV